MKFSKYQGTGNDFILIDARFISEFTVDIKALCDRHFGIGADGLMLLRKHTEFDFLMDYYNSDGNPSSMCGNGGRCIVQFAHSLGLSTNNEANFLAVDGPHKAIISENLVELHMIDVENVQQRNEDTYVLNTGSPHYVQFQSSDIFEDNLIQNATNIRYNSEFKEKGINVNFVNILGENELQMRTYERGVEDETLSCGTGVTAAALSYLVKTNKYGTNLKIKVKTKGGDLSVTANSTINGFNNVALCGPAIKVFDGEI